MTLIALDIKVDGDEEVVLTPHYTIVRVRRITGYLSNVKNFNAAKKRRTVGSCQTFSFLAYFGRLIFFFLFFCIVHASLAPDQRTPNLGSLGQRAYFFALFNCFKFHYNFLLENKQIMFDI